MKLRTPWPTLQVHRAGFRVDGQDFHSADDVIRYLVADHTKAELVELIVAMAGPDKDEDEA